jgi:hypothetical protein
LANGVVGHPLANCRTTYNHDCQPHAYMPHGCLEEKEWGQFRSQERSAGLQRGGSIAVAAQTEQHGLLPSSQVGQAVPDTSIHATGIRHSLNY